MTRPAVGREELEARSVVPVPPLALPTGLGSSSREPHARPLRVEGLRVLHVVQGYAPAVGGSERVIQRLSEELVSSFGDRVTVFTTDCRSAEAFPRPSHPRLAHGRESVRGVEIHRFAVVRTFGPWLHPVQRVAYRLGLPLNDHLRTWYAGPILPGLTRAVARHGADLVAATSFPLRHMYQALRGAERTGRPCVLIGGIHPEDRWGFDRPMIYRAIRRAERYVAYTELEARHVVACGASPERIDVIGVGVDADDFADVDPEPLRHELALGHAPIVGFVGQLGVHKGISYLLDAMPLVWARRPDVRLLIAGASTVYAEQLDRMVSRLPAEARAKVIVRLDFAEDEKPRLFSLLDVLAYPSEYESFGLSFLEAWAAGKPVIGCRRGAVTEVVRDGRDGLLVPYADPAALAEALLALLDDAARARALGEAGRRRVRAENSWRAVATRFRQSYLEALATGGPGRRDLR